MRRASRDNALVNCCFHAPDKRPSLCINKRDGRFYCFSCGAKGGDIIDFLMQRDGLTFRQACERLGAWTNSTPEAKCSLERDRREREQLQRERQKIEAEVKRLRFSARD